MMRPFRFADLGAVGALAALIAVPFPGIALAQTAPAQAAPAQPAPQPEPAAPAQAAPKLETFGRWSTLVDEVDTGEDLRKTCAASTAFIGAGGESGVLTLIITNGDALPPDAYPSITIAVDNKTLPAGKSVTATFGDDKGRVTAKLHSDGAVNGRLSWTVDNQAKTAWRSCAPCAGHRCLMSPLAMRRLEAYPWRASPRPIAVSAHRAVFRPPT